MSPFSFFKKNKVKLPERDIDDLKKITKILFIDDRAFGNVDIIKNDGWKNTMRIKDADSLDQTEIREAHILFVDIQGVGKRLKFKDQGLGLIQAIKQKYPNKKVIVYSSEDQGKIEAFHPGIDAADSRLPKNADPYQYQVLIEKYSAEAFDLSECIDRIQKLMINEFGHSVTRDEVTKNLENIYKSQTFDVASIGKAFSISNAGSIADIVSLFFAP